MSVTLARAAFASASKGRLRIDKFNISYTGDGKNSQMMAVTGWHADGTPFAHASPAFAAGADTLEIARQVGAHLIETKAAEDRRVAPALPQKGDQAMTDAPKSTPDAKAKRIGAVTGLPDRFLSKLSQATGVGPRLLGKIEARCDAIIERESGIEARIEDAFASHDQVLDGSEHMLDLAEEALHAVSNAPLSNSRPSSLAGDKQTITTADVGKIEDVIKTPMPESPGLQDKKESV
jgi:hypothetical protein